jgi:hypothetical protein
MMDARTRAAKSHRTRLRRRGFKRVEVQVPAAEVEVIRRAASVLRHPTEEAAQLRRQLGFDTDRRQARTALDIFAMPEPLSAEGERLWEQTMKQVARDRKDRRLNRPRDIDL